jgi:hypothetical protein
MATNHEPTSQSTASYRGALAAVQPVAPITIGPKNCEQAIGAPWRWTRAKAVELGVPLLEIDGKTVIEAEALLAAFKKHGALRETERLQMAEPGSADELAMMRQRLSERRVGGAR